MSKIETKNVVNMTDVKEAEIKEVPVEVPAEPAELTVAVKPNLFDKAHELDYNRRLKKAQKKAEKQAKKEAAAAEPKEESSKTKKILKAAGVATVFVAGVTGALLFGGKGSSGDGPVELGEGDVTASDAPAELPAMETISIPDPVPTDVPATEA